MDLLVSLCGDTVPIHGLVFGLKNGLISGRGYCYIIGIRYELYLFEFSGYLGRIGSI